MHSIEGWVGPMSSLVVFEKRNRLCLPGSEPRIVQPVVQSLYRKRYPKYEPKTWLL